MDLRTPPLPTLHYIFDPLCGWCYAAAPLVGAARQVPGLAVAFHGGGMMAGLNARTIDPQWRAHVMPHDLRIAELTGQPFGEAYFEGLLRDTAARLDSVPPTTAVLAAESLGGRGLDMLHRLQHAHYVEGRRIAERAVLRELAVSIGLAGEAFDGAFDAQSGEPTLRHIGQARGLLGQLGGRGFPTFAWEAPGQAPVALDAGPWLGRPADWRAHLLQRIGGAAVAAGFTPLEGCADGACAPR